MAEDLQKYHLNVTSIERYEGLSSDWITVESSSNETFFLSWNWINNWLESYSPKVDVLTVRFEGNLVGIALLCRSEFSQANRFNSKRLHINQTGDSRLDQIWTEYNGILSSIGHEASVRLLMLPYLVSNYASWDELHVGAVTEELARSMSESSGLSRIDMWQSPSYGVNLKRLKDNKLSYLDSLSRNTRYQIRRSIKLYGSDGPFALHFASSQEQAISYFNEIAPFHIAKWGTGEGQSGFTNPHFVKFHKNLISNTFHLGCIDLIKITSGERVLGYLYNFIYRDCVYFYLSGLVTENDAKLKPGLSAHSQVIQHYLDNDFAFYDFMGGDDRYKSSLGEKHAQLYQIALQKNLAKFKIESCLRKLKGCFNL